MVRLGQLEADEDQDDDRDHTEDDHQGGGHLTSRGQRLAGRSPSFRGVYGFDEEYHPNEDTFAQQRLRPLSGAGPDQLDRPVTHLADDGSRCHGAPMFLPTLPTVASTK